MGMVDDRFFACVESMSFRSWLSFESKICDNCPMSSFFRSSRDSCCDRGKEFEDRGENGGDVNPFSDFGDIGLDSFSAGSWASGTTNVSSLASYTSSVTDDSSVRKSSQFVFWTNIE